MKIDHKIVDGNLVISITPNRTVKDGLKVIYGKGEMQENGMEYIPAIERDLEQGRSSYDLPPDFDASKIIEVDVANEAISGEFVAKW